MCKHACVHEKTHAVLYTPASICVCLARTVLYVSAWLYGRTRAGACLYSRTCTHARADMCLYTCTHTGTRAHASLHAQRHAYTHLPALTSLGLHTHAPACTRSYTREHTRVFAYMHTWPRRASRDLSHHWLTCEQGTDAAQSPHLITDAVPAQHRAVSHSCTGVTVPVSQCHPGDCSQEH